jgi:hypothetical protein
MCGLPRHAIDLEHWPAPITAICVPAVPSIRLARSSSCPIAARLPVASTNRHTASTFIQRGKTADPLVAPGDHAAKKGRTTQTGR